MAEHEVTCMQRRLHPLTVQLRCRNVFAETPSLDWLEGAQGLIIGGSGAFSVHDPRSRDFVGPLRGILDHCLKHRVPTFGICFGHQLLGMHLGSQVITDESRREIGTLPIELTPEGQRDLLFTDLPPAGTSKFKAVLGHTDHVESLPTGATLLAETQLSPVQALHVDGTRAYSTQFHPDLSGEESRERYRAFAQAVGPKEQAAMQAKLEYFESTPLRAEHLLRHFVTRVVLDDGEPK